MGQFKPMVKMETTEPSIELKLKKGGKVESGRFLYVAILSELIAAGRPLRRGCFQWPHRGETCRSCCE